MADIIPLQLGMMTASRHSRDDGLPSHEETWGDEEAFQVQTQLRDLHSHKLWCNSHLVFDGGQSARTLTINDLRPSWRGCYLSSFDRISFHIPFPCLQGFARQVGRPEFNGLQCSGAVQDETLNGLAQALLPALANPQQASRLFLEQIGLAILAHLTQAYGGLCFSTGRKGTLASWQEARATEFLASHVVGDFSLDVLAETCALSRSYFSKAFKQSFGKSPYRWLLEYRVARAKDMLRSDLPISQVALDCGFADQSHLTRVFSMIQGETPGQWRRALRSPVAHGSCQDGLAPLAR
ncbi:helix-turn-helix domain-containing protein [Paracoccus litorisediminis]|uniref:Helix-turn-helix domain-containing protein n=1 Tax=Paracoccus litorisediminis TaxID=2006130 RepID=A0A844HPV2_9RHOB|nr:AraC family transcriptional regulator [Paracoccus litorisediminis]MTH62423.1 helix-turn-helix domain-containing protein [Paracoccus litorisediminis]